MDDAMFEARTKHPHLRVGRMKLHRLETKEIDRDRLDIGFVLALADLYELRISDLDPALADEIRAITELGNRVSPCTPRTPRGGGRSLLNVA